jgi:hypothetical protein
MERALAAWSETRIARVEALARSRFAETTPAQLRDAILYPLQSGGKRSAPAARDGRRRSRGAIGAQGTPPDRRSPSSSSTRTRSCTTICRAWTTTISGAAFPPCTRSFGEGPAVLVGDALLTEAFLLAAETENAALVRELALAAGTPE